MTREEAIEKLKNFADHCYPNEEFLMAIKALEQEPKETWSIKDVATTFERHGLMTEQEPCGDAISREELLKAIDTWDRFGVDDTNSLFRLDNLSLPHYVPYIHYDDVIKCIKGIPSVNPQEPKTGHWIDHQDGRWIYAKCSECGTVHDTQTNYCPNCGAKMESEGKK